jgi:hypothetical protein
MSIVTQKGIKENSDYDDMAGPLLVVVFFGLLLSLVITFKFKYQIYLNIIYRKGKFNLVTFTDLASQVV